MDLDKLSINDAPEKLALRASLFGGSRRVRFCRGTV